ncbi:hypothetical protein [Nocardioides sp. zg-DK7169]|uniref:hypothetical protein n=1 Tax=Nocardioides sp. zg-DK7169 TaxID=2736600 RepID=UPI00155180E5|nr:hypothetical protein [Nocardioides sp. zg-DK7169]NPC99021.1 hypothetical protein [Nocardioides sp. zg-DK7169]
MTETGSEQPERPPRTGDAGVDGVLAAVDSLAGRPLQEHVAVFEDAHDRLRAALDVPTPAQPGATRPHTDA